MHKNYFGKLVNFMKNVCHRFSIPGYADSDGQCILVCAIQIRSLLPPMLRQGGSKVVERQVEKLIFEVIGIC